MSTTGGTASRARCYVLDEPAAISKKFKRAVTDSGTARSAAAPDKPGVTNLIDILAAARGVTPEEVEAEIADARGYGDLKVAVAEAVVETCARPERYEELRADEAAWRSRSPRAPRRRARIAAETLADVRAAMGVGPPPVSREPALASWRV